MEIWVLETSTKILSEKKTQNQNDVENDKKWEWNE